MFRRKSGHPGGFRRGVLQLPCAQDFSATRSHQNAAMAIWIAHPVRKTMEWNPGMFRPCGRNPLCRITNPAQREFFYDLFVGNHMDENTINSCDEYSGCTGYGGIPDTQVIGRRFHGAVEMAHPELRQFPAVVVGNFYI